MEYLLEKVKKNIYVVAIWDAGWNAYNNCYLIVEDNGVTVIDSCKKEHTSYLEQALARINKTTADVKLVLATHGHEDHVQGAVLFKHAKKVIHQKEQTVDFDYLLNDHGTIQDFEYSLVGYHTPGSVVYYHRPSKTIFTGDFLCFFGDPLSKDGLVSKGDDLRNAWIEYLEGGGIPKKELPNFLAGLKTIRKFDSEAMCTGHGGVLVGDIDSFVETLLNSEVLS